MTPRKIGPMEHQLDKLVALKHQVEVCAGDDCSDKPGIYFSFIGMLEMPEDGYERYFLRVGDTYWGTQGIGFHPTQVLEVHTRASGLMRIELKEHLHATQE